MDFPAARETDVEVKKVRSGTFLFASSLKRGTALALACSPLALHGGALAADGISGPTPDGTPIALLVSQQAAPAAVTPVPASTSAILHDPYAQPPGSDLSAPLPPSVELARSDTTVPPAMPVEPPPGATESLRDAIVEALKSNPDIQIALARQDDAKYGVDEARAGYLPHLDLAVALGSEYNDPATTGTTTLRRGEGVVTLSQNVWDFGTTINDIKRARASYRSAQWSTREQIEAIAFDITTAYTDVLERQKLVELSVQEIAAHEKILKMVTIQNELGLTTVADVNRAKARLDNVQAELLDRKSALQQSRESYRRLTSHLPAVATDLPSPASALPASADAAVAMIDDHSPRMAQAVEDRRSLDRQRASQTGTFFPRVGFQAQGNWKDDVQGNTGLNRDARAMVTVTYSFFNGGADIAIRNRISARLREADYELDRRRREVEQDIRIDFNALEAARAKIATIDSEIQASERVVDLYIQQFREGRRTVFDLLDSQQVLFNARASQVTNGTAKMVSEFRVLQKLGGLFDLVSSGEPLPPLVVPAPGRGK
jgi:TolC family type I secretion outer membrane protein